MNKYNNPRLLNTVVSGTGMKNPVRPHVIIGSEENGFIRGDLMDANAIQELIVTEIAAREHGDEELTEYIDEKVQLAVDDLVDGAPEVLDTLKELSEALGDDANFATTITEEIASKVDKVEGKGLSTNDYTNAEKQKLAGIAAGAEVNVQSDWNVTNSSNDAFIKNKPTKLSLFTNDVPYATQDYIINNFETKTRVTELKQSIKEKIDNIESVLPMLDANGHAYVDLGLPSGTLWATMNVGAERNKQYGNQYMYGKGSTQYILGDDIYTGMESPLDLSVDTVRQEWGGDWRTPTKEQFEELLEYTTMDINESEDVIFTGSNGNQLLIPPFPTSKDDTWRYLWTSTPVEGDPTKAYVFYEYYNYMSTTKTDVIPFDRNHNQCSLRGVLPGKKQVASKDDVDELKENLTFNVDELKEDLTFTETTDPANGHEYVDLGLPSGTKWATMNVGASSATDYGNYYMYGMGSKTYDSTDTPYSGTEDPLALSADTAAQEWGGDWHMPTSAQMQELIANTTYQWVTNYKGSGINGGTFTATNGAVLFIPAAGHWGDGSQYNVSNGGRYWGSWPNGSNNAFCLNFDNGGKNVSNGGRKYGYPVRGVLDKDAQVETITTPVKEVVTDLKSNEEVIAAALNNLNTKIEATNLRIETSKDFKGSINEYVDYFTKFTPNTVGVDDAAGVFDYNVNLLQELVTNNNTEMLLTTTRNNKKLIVGTIRFFTDNFAHQVTAIATSNIHLDEWDKESSLSGVSHTDGKAYTYVCFCGLNDPAAYSGLQEGVWTDWKKLYPTMDDLDEAVNTLKNRQYMDSSMFDAIFTEADSDAIDYIIDNFAPTFYVKGSSNSVVTCSIVRSATKVCVFRNRVDEQSGDAIQECIFGTIGTNGTITWGSWMNISATMQHTFN